MSQGSAAFITLRQGIMPPSVMVSRRWGSTSRNSLESATDSLISITRFEKNRHALKGRIPDRFIPFHPLTLPGC